MAAGPAFDVATGTTLAALSREFRATLDAATKGGARPGDRVDEFSLRLQAKLGQEIPERRYMA